MSKNDIFNIFTESIQSIYYSYYLILDNYQRIDLKYLVQYDDLSLAKSDKFTKLSTTIFIEFPSKSNANQIGYDKSNKVVFYSMNKIISDVGGFGQSISFISFIMFSRMFYTWFAKDMAARIGEDEQEIRRRLDMVQLF